MEFFIFCLSLKIRFWNKYVLSVTGLVFSNKTFILPCLNLKDRYIRNYLKLGASVVLLNLKTNETSNLIFNLLSDSFKLLSRGIAKLIKAHQLEPINMSSCSNPQYWKSGQPLMKKMLNSSFLGRSGIVELDENGKRANFDLNILHIKLGQRFHEGIWNKKQGLYMSR